MITPINTFFNYLRRALHFVQRHRYIAAFAGAFAVLSLAGLTYALHSTFLDKPSTPGAVTNPTAKSPSSSNSGTATTPTTKSPSTTKSTDAAKTSPSSTATTPSTTPSAGGGSTGTVAPTGAVFALLDPGDTSGTMQTYASKSNVDGLAFRATWSSMETSAGSYNWSYIDAALAAAASNGKKVTVHVGTSAGGTPSWVIGMGAQTYTYSTPSGSHTDPIPWDSTYLQRYNQFVAALGQHINASGKMSLVQAASAGAPVSEMTIVGCANGTLNGGTSYNRASYLNAWTSTIAANAAAYPGKKILVSLPLSFICANDGNDGKSFMTQLMNAAKATAPVGYYAADLNAAGSTRLTQADSSLRSNLGIFFQTIWSSTNDPQNRMQGSLSSAVCYGWNAGSRYVEIYKTDLASTDPGITTAINQARTGSGC